MNKALGDRYRIKKIDGGGRTGKEKKKEILECPVQKFRSYFLCNDMTD